MTIKERPTSDFLAIVVVEQKKESMTVGEIKNALHERGFGIRRCDLSPRIQSNSGGHQLECR